MRLPIDEAQSDGLSADTGESAQHRPARRCGLFLHCTGQPHIVIEHKDGRADAGLVRPPEERRRQVPSSVLGQLGSTAQLKASSNEI